MTKLILADVRSISRDGKTTGHYFNVASNYIDMFEDKFEVVIAGGPVYDKYFPKTLLLKYNTNLEGSRIKNKLKVISNCFELLKKVDDSVVVLQSNAVATTFLALFLFPKRRNIYTIQYNTMSLDTRLKRVLFKLAKSKISGVICPSNTIGEAYDIPYYVIQDYVFTEKQYKILPEIHTEKIYDFALVGIITRDKGVIEAANRLAKTKYKVIIAGRPSDESIRKELIDICCSSNNITLILDYIDNDAYDHYIRMSKYCILNYSSAYSEHSSGVVFDVLYRGTPVLGRECYFLNFIQEEKLGIIFNDINECDFEKILEDSTRKQYIKNIRTYLKKQLNISEGLFKFLQR